MVTDELTGLKNRRFINERMSVEFARARRYHRPVSYILFDIDFFKQVNDNYGHLVGDDVLKKLSNIIKSKIREDDLFARWGGEEFVLVLNTSIEQALTIANNLRSFIEKSDFEVAGKITCSFGMTQFKKNDTLDMMILRADSALYEAKARGRNRVCQA